MKYLKLILFAFALSAAVACSNDDDSTDTCYVSETTGVDAVEGPETTTVNTPVTLNVTLSVSNSCGDFVEFVETNDEPSLISAKVDYTGCTCADIIEVITVPYVFEADAPGEYTLNFVSSDELFISKTITVTE